jgi:hypothetical protein
MLLLFCLVASAYFSSSMTTNSGYIDKHYPLTYTAFKCPSASFIDRINGDIEKPEWEDVPWSEPFDDIRGPGDAPPSSRPPSGCSTRVKMMWDEKYLYIAALLESLERTVVTSFTERNSPIFQQDSDFEVFIDPAGSCHNYKELELNAFNTVWNLLLDKPYDDGGQEHSGRVAKDPSDSKYWEVHHEVTATKIHWGRLNDPNGAIWSVEIALAHSDSLSMYPSSLKRSFFPRKGTQWRINFSRVEDKGQINWTWAKQVVWDPKLRRYQGKVAMHLPDAWGYLNFAESRDDKEIFDETFPVRFAAMNVYYAQRYYKQLHNKYASTKDELIPYTDESVLAPFDIHISTTPNHAEYKANLRCRKGSVLEASVTYDRLLWSNSKGM